MSLSDANHAAMLYRSSLGSSHIGCLHIVTDSTRGLDWDGIRSTIGIEHEYRPFSSTVCPFKGSFDTQTPPEVDSHCRQLGLSKEKALLTKSTDFASMRLLNFRKASTFPGS